MPQKWARSFGGRGTRSFANLAKIEIFPKRRLDTFGRPPIGIGWLKNILLWSVEVTWLDFGWIWKTFFWPNIFCKAIAWIRSFWLKTLSKSSEVIELDLKLGKSPDGNFWHKYPKVMWDNGKQIKTGLSNFEIKSKNYFSPIWRPGFCQILGNFHSDLTRSLELRFNFFTPFLETRSQAWSF